MGLTALIRTSYRPTQFQRCIDSVPEQCNIIVSYDDDRALPYIRQQRRMLARIRVEKTKQEYGYNFYCNYLKYSMIYVHGLYLDEDDTMINQPPPLEDGVSYLAPFMRGKFLTPWKPSIRRGLIGMPCLLLWWEHRDLIKFEAVEDADFRAIDSLSKQVELRWLDVPLVYSEKRNYGVVEK